MCLCYLFSAKTAYQLVNRKADFFYKTNRFESIRITNRIESIRIANWNALQHITQLIESPVTAGVNWRQALNLRSVVGPFAHLHCSLG